MSALGSAYLSPSSRWSGACPQIVLDTWKGSIPVLWWLIGSLCLGSATSGCHCRKQADRRSEVEEMTERSAWSHALFVASAKVCNDLVSSDAQVWWHRAT